MGLITPANLNILIDPCVQAYMRVDGVAAQVYGIGAPGDAWGAVEAIDTLITNANTVTDIEVTGAIANAILSLDKNVKALKWAGGRFSALFRRIEANMKSNPPVAAVTDFDTYLTYYNITHATKWQALQHNEWYDLYNAWKAGQRPSVENLYFEVLQGTVYSNALAELVIVGPAFTDGFAIDETKYAGGFPQVIMSGFAGAADTVTVTGKQRKPDGTTSAGVTWDVSVTGNGVFALAPNTAEVDSLIYDVTNIVAGGNITAGTLYAEAARPAGRPLLP